MSEETISTTELGDKILLVLKTIYDPEIPVDIYELGLIYDVFVNEDFDVKILIISSKFFIPLLIFNFSNSFLNSFDVSTPTSALIKNSSN